jgi:biotin carboxylase
LKTFLVVGCGVLQSPMIEKAKALGLGVIATDMNPNAPGCGLADHFCCASTFDPAATLEALGDLRPDGVATMGTDFPMRTVAAIGERFGLRTISSQTATQATDKRLMREAFARAGVPSPRSIRVASAQEAAEAQREIGLPVIVKPTTRSGSAGVSRVDTPADIGAAYDRAVEAARGGEILVEEFLTGPEISVETMTCGGVFRVIAITQKSTTGAPHFVETGHFIPADLDADMVQTVCDVARAANEALGIDIGPTHTEMKIQRGQPTLVELGARLGGDRITSHLVPLATGVDMVEATIRVALGEEPDLAPRWQRGASIRYIHGLPGYDPATCGALEGWSGLEQARAIPGVIEADVDMSIGDRIGGPLRSSLDRPGYAIAEGATAAEAVAVAEAARDTIGLRLST